MSFEMLNGSFLVKDAAGVIKFSSSMESYVETDFLSGSFSIPRRSTVGTPYNNGYSYNLGSCLPAANIVLGAVKVARADTFATGALEISPTDAWNSVGGTLILGAGRGSWNSSNAVSGDGPFLIGIQTLTISAIGGSVVANEQVHAFSQPSASVQQWSFVGTPAWTVSFKLSIGLFDRHRHRHKRLNGRRRHHHGVHATGARG
jgi:hypothetical protein